VLGQVLQAAGCRQRQLPLFLGGLQFRRARRRFAASNCCSGVSFILVSKRNVKMCSAPSAVGMAKSASPPVQIRISPSPCFRS
jgi:hypothetical protein